MRDASVAVDDEAGGRIALDHLIASGATRLVMVNGGLDIPQCANRSRGAHEASAACALSSSFEEITIAEMTVNAGIRVGTQLATHPPQGVFCTNDQLAIGVIHALIDAGLRVPEDVAVVGYGDLVAGEREQGAPHDGRAAERARRSRRCREHDRRDHG